MALAKLPTLSANTLSRLKVTYSHLVGRKSFARAVCAEIAEVNLSVAMDARLPGYAAEQQIAGYRRNTYDTCREQGLTAAHAEYACALYDAAVIAGDCVAVLAAEYAATEAEALAAEVRYAAEAEVAEALAVAQQELSEACATASGSVATAIHAREEGTITAAQRWEATARYDLRIASFLGKALAAKLPDPDPTPGCDLEVTSADSGDVSCNHSHLDHTRPGSWCVACGADLRSECSDLGAACVETLRALKLVERATLDCGRAYRIGEHRAARMASEAMERFEADACDSLRWLAGVGKRVALDMPDSAPVETQEARGQYDRTQPLYVALAGILGAYRACEARLAKCFAISDDPNARDWAARHHGAILAIRNETAPRGSGIDSGTGIDCNASSDRAIVLTCSFHHMDENGSYDGWTEHTITVRPSFAGFDLSISGRDRNGVKEYLHDVYARWLHTPVSRSDMDRWYGRNCEARAS